MTWKKCNDEIWCTYIFGISLFIHGDDIPKALVDAPKPPVQALRTLYFLSKYQTMMKLGLEIINYRKLTVVLNS